MKTKSDSIALFIGMAAIAFIVSLPTKPAPKALYVPHTLVPIEIPTAWEGINTNDTGLLHEAGLIFNRNQRRVTAVEGYPASAPGPSPVAAQSKQAECRSYANGEQINGYTHCDGVWVDDTDEKCFRYVSVANQWHWVKCGKCGRTNCTCGDACPGKGCTCGAAILPNQLSGASQASGGCANGQCGSNQQRVFGRRR